jgi:hypothetical protein
VQYTCLEVRWIVLGVPRIVTWSVISILSIMSLQRCWLCLLKKTWIFLDKWFGGLVHGYFWLRLGLLLFGQGLEESKQLLKYLSLLIQDIWIINLLEKRLIILYYWIRLNINAIALKQWSCWETGLLDTVHTYISVFFHGWVIQEQWLLMSLAHLELLEERVNCFVESFS